MDEDINESKTSAEKDSSGRLSSVPAGIKSVSKLFLSFFTKIDLTSGFNDGANTSLQLRPFWIILQYR